MLRLMPPLMLSAKVDAVARLHTCSLCQLAFVPLMQCVSAITRGQDRVLLNINELNALANYLYSYPSALGLDFTVLSQWML